jgi:glucuronate isomerase
MSCVAVWHHRQTAFSTADEIWDQCNALLAQDNFSARGIMKQMNVKMVSTDDPIDSPGTSCRCRQRHLF